VVLPDLGHPGRCDVSRRHPRWIYGTGRDPDPRFSLANERTFLAWTRTSLAFLAGGVALETIDLHGPDRLQGALTVALVLLGLACAVASWVHWARTERAMRRQEPLPPPLMAAVLAVALGIVAAVLLVLVL
jgi:putative membrane protein